MIFAAVLAVATAAVGLVAAPAAAQATDCAQVVADYQYGTDDPAYQALTATTNTCREGARWILTVHGGSWINGDRTKAQNAVNAFYAHAWQVFNVEYRRGVDVTWQQQRDDVVAAWDWVTSHAAEFGIDPARGNAYGFSAGGHLVAWLANLRPAVGAVVTVDGVLQPQRVADDDNGLRPDEPSTPAMHNLHLREVTMLGVDWLHTMPSPWPEFMPQTGITADTAPTFIVQGADDTTVPPNTAHGYAYHLYAHGVARSVHVVAGYGHTSGALVREPYLFWVACRWLVAETDLRR
jgi:acetyl esterase/lipase